MIESFEMEHAVDKEKTEIFVRQCVVQFRVGNDFAHA